MGTQIWVKLGWGGDPIKGFPGRRAYNNNVRLKTKAKTKRNFIYWENTNQKTQGFLKKINIVTI